MITLGEVKKRIGSRLGHLRDYHDLTQAQLAEKLDCSDKYISQIERADVAVSIKKLVQLANVLDSDIESFFEDNDNQYTGIEKKKYDELGEDSKKLIDELIRVFYALEGNEDLDSEEDYLN